MIMERKTYDIIYPEPMSPGVILESNVFTPMRDGVEIATDIYKPAEGDGPWPVIFAYSGYKKEYIFESPLPGFYVQNGYAVVYSQARGTGQSQGKYTFHGKYEARDGYDIVEWIARQPWCDGNVAMLGASYYAVNMWLTAVQNPPHLKCIVPFPGTTDNYRGLIYPGGVFRSSFIGGLLSGLLKVCIWPGPVPGKELPENPVLEILAHPEDGPYYWERSVWHRMDRIKIPVLNIVPTSQHLHTTSHLKSYEDIESPKKLIITPWTHMVYMRFSIECLPLNQQILRWLDYWLKGIDTGIMDEPEVAIYDNGTGEWRYENEYPLARTAWRKFYLHEKTTATEPWGLISDVSPTEKERAGTYRYPGSAFGPKEFLAYTTPPLEEDLVVRGPVSITFYASTTDENTADWTFFVKVGDISPGGKPLDPMNNPRDPINKPLWTDAWTPPDVWLWSFGNLKAKYLEVDESRSKPGQPWHSFQNPADLKPNTIYEFQIELMPIFNTFRKGHRIWLQIASQDMEFDNQDAFSPSGMALSGWSYRNAYKSEIAVYHSPEYPSHILLPIIPDAPEIARVEAPLRDVVPGAPSIE